MPTVSAICDRVSHVTGLSTTGTDRTKILSYVQQAYDTSVLEAGAYTATASKSLTSGTADYTIGTAPLDIDGLLEIRALWIDDDAVDNIPLRQIPEHEILSLRQGETVSSTPLYYAVRGTRELLLFPTPGANTTLKVSYLAEPPTLVEATPGAGEEDTPTAVPGPFHYDVLANKAISLALEYDNRFEEAATFDAKWAVGMDRMLAWVARFGGPVWGSTGTDGFEGPRDMDRI